MVYSFFSTVPLIWWASSRDSGPPSSFFSSHLSQLQFVAPSYSNSLFHSFKTSSLRAKTSSRSATSLWLPSLAVPFVTELSVSFLRPNWKPFERIGVEFLHEIGKLSKGDGHLFSSFLNLVSGRTPLSKMMRRSVTFKCLNSLGGFNRWPNLKLSFFGSRPPSRSVPCLSVSTGHRLSVVQLCFISEGFFCFS